MKDNIKKLRQKTGAGMMDCKHALNDSGGDMDKAVEILRKKGVSVAAKKSSRATNEGIIESYIHHGNKIGVILEVNCETDFVARNKDFRAFVKDVAMQIAAACPAYVKREDVPEKVIDKEKEIFGEQMKDKPANVIEKILQGKLEKFYEETCLLEQPYIKDPNLKIKDLLTSIIAKTGENISVKRFVRYQVGEES
jgi:elongation factor Ts